MNAGEPTRRGTLYGPCPGCAERWTPIGERCRYCIVREQRLERERASTASGREAEPDEENAR